MYYSATIVASFEAPTSHQNSVIIFGNMK